MAVNSNRITATKLVRRAKQIADISNTDFLNYEEDTEYLNSAWKNVYQTIINYNLNVFTVEATLVGAAGVYKLPFDCYQIKSVKNPLTGREIPRRADSESLLGATYEIVNDTIRLGPSAGPVSIIYWRKPFFLSIPDKEVKTQFDRTKYEILASCNNSILIRDNLVGAEQKLYIQNLLTDSTLELPYNYNPEYNYDLCYNFIIEYKDDYLAAYDFYGNLISEISDIDFDYRIIKADNGLCYFGTINSDDNNIIDVHELFGDKIAEVVTDENTQNIIGIDGEFYPVNVEHVFPIGVFDDRPAYITENKELRLINPNGSEIIEKIDVPSIGTVTLTRYGFLTFDGTLYSCIPDTELDFPNNLYYDCISYDLAVRYLCKMNADSTGVENLNKNAWNQLTASIDQSADFPRIKLVRR